MSSRYVEDLKLEFDNLSRYHELLMRKAKVLRADMDVLLKELDNCEI